jgi:formylglycine-generating enzyme required for sulfatase activity
MEKKMPWLTSKISHYLFCVLTLTFGICACGTDNTHDFKSKQSTTGTYQPALIFPGDIPREASTAQAVTGIDCEANQISTIEFTFNMNESSHGPHSFACQDHQASIKGIPVGTDIRVDVYAYDDNHVAVLYGFEITDIHAGQVTEGGEIEMKSVDDPQAQDNDGDGYNSHEDCNDADADINPNAPEIPDNNVDEDCDGQAELSSFTIADLGMVFVRIPPGEFDMGSPRQESGRDDDETLHRVVRLTQAYYLMNTEVTQGQWRMVVDATADTTLDPNPSYFTNCGDDCPVEWVTWNEVQLFIRALEEMYQGAYEFRLPTEAQWEYAAIAGSDTAFSGGPITVPDSGLDPVLDTLGWYNRNSDVGYDPCVSYADSSDGYSACLGSHPVAGKIPNTWGLYDMHGNVYEWCRDWYEDYPTGNIIDPQGPNNGTWRLLRGGSMEEGADDCRSAYRGTCRPDDTNTDCGFRLVGSPLNNLTGYETQN